MGQSTDIVGFPFPLTPTDWTNVQATRAFALLSVFSGGGGAAIGAWSLYQGSSPRVRTLGCFLTAVAAFCGFVSMCTWEVFTNSDARQYGACFIIVIVAWLAHVGATVAGVLQLRGGVSGKVKNVTSAGSVLWCGQQLAFHLPMKALFMG